MRSLIRFAIFAGMLLPAFAPALTTINLAQGWNLVGNSDPDSIDVSVARFGNQINTVWKWNKTTSKWAFFAPSMTPTQLDAYALQKGYEVLTTIDPKDGFWVNAVAATQITDPLSPPPAPGTRPSLAASDLVSGWNLMASGDGLTPSQLNTALNSSLNGASQGIATVWSWDASASNWKFYAPALEAKGGTALADYIAAKKYLSFSGVMGLSDGFWINIGPAAPITAPPSPTASLRALNFTSSNDWFLRIYSSTAAQNTPAADGSTRYREMRTARASGGVPYSWTTGGQPARGADVHWNGTSWVNCQINVENTTSAPDANGDTTYRYCNGWETGPSAVTLSTVDISSKPMIDVYSDIQASGATNFQISSAVAALGAATFPANSKVNYRTSPANYLPTIGYYPGIGNWAYLSDALVGAGDSTACNANPFPIDSPNATLDQLIAVNQGKPCVYGVHTVTGANGVTLNSGTRNEYWGGTTLSMGKIGTAPTYADFSNATSYYTSNQRLRVSFAANNEANYYSCQERWNGSTRNCDLLGTGNYSIQVLGNSRVMTFSGLPTQFSALTYTGVFVERGGHVYYGYLDTPTTNTQARLNLTGLSALFSTLGLPAFDPEVPIKLGVGSYSGNYSGTISGADSGTFNTSVNPSGTTTCSGSVVSVGAFSCTFGLVPTGTDGTNAAVTLGIVGTGALFTGTVNYYTGVVSGTWSNGAATGTFTGNRL